MLSRFKFQADVPNSENKNAQYEPRDELRGLFGHSTRGRQEIQIRVPQVRKMNDRQAFSTPPTQAETK
jgi:hypothetical protein